MKKLCIAILLGTMMFSLGACGKETDTTETTEVVEETTETTDTTNATETTDTTETAVETSSLEILETLWGTYGEEEKFAIVGGDSANAVSDMPGSFDVTNTDELDRSLGFPAAQAELIDEAASLVHMMNANTFTCGAFHVANAQNVNEVADALKENIMNRQWMCGMPDTLIIAVVHDEYVISAFGNGEIMEAFKTKFLASDATAVIMYEESIVE